MALTDEEKLQLERERFKFRKSQSHSDEKEVDTSIRPTGHAEATPVMENDFSDTGNVFTNPNATVSGNLREVGKNTVNELGTLWEGAKGFAGGILNAGDNLNEFALSVPDAIIGTDMAGRYRENHPERTWGDGMAGEIGTTLGENTPGAVAGTITGTAAGQALTKGTTLTGKAVQAGSSLLGSEIGSTITSDKDQDNLVYGSDDSIFGNGWDIHEDDDHAAKVLKKSVNNFVDNIITMGAAGAGGKVASAIGGYGSGIWNKIFKRWHSLSAQQQDMAEQMFDLSNKASESQTNKARVKAMKEFADKVEANGEELLRMGGEDPDVVLKKDTITAITDSMNPKDNVDDAIAKGELDSLRAAARHSSSPRLNRSIDAPRDTYENTLTGMQERRGGIDSMNKTIDAVRQSADNETVARELALGAQADRIATKEQDLIDIAKQDTDFGNRFKKSQTNPTNLNVNKEAIDKQTELSFKYVDDEKKAKELRDKAYDALGESTAKADMDSFNKAYSEVESIMGVKSTENPNGISQALKNAVENSDGTYGYLHKEILPKVNAELSKAYNSNDQVTIDALQALKKNIRQEQITKMKMSGDRSVIDLANAADSANRNYSKQFNDGLGREVKDLMKKEKFMKQGQNITFTEQSRARILGAIKDPNRRESVSQMIRTFGGEGSEGADLVADVALNEAMKDMIHSKMTPEDFKKVLPKLQDMQAAFPQKQSVRISKFINNIEKGTLDVETMKNELTEMTAAAKEAKKNLYEKKLKGFFEQVDGGKYANLPNSEAVLTKMMANEQGMSQLKEVMQRAGPDNLPGLQAAWADLVKKQTTSNSIDVPNIQRHIVEMGNELFKDAPEAVDALVTLNKRANEMATVSKKNKTGGFDYSKYQVEGQKGVNQVLTWVFGVLNPTAAKIRTISSDLSKQYDSKDIAQEAADIILSDPKEFARVLRDVANNKTKLLTPMQKKILFRLSVKAGYHFNDQEDGIISPTIEQQTKQGLGDRNRVELTVDKANGQ